ncbi:MULTISPECIES: hypothetical protein [unclassified Kribbella]|uniref:hypothetical protein n=1 Tax=unclassified Kribbella TaxID=2644121 RepID=UPI00301A30F8
MTSTARITPPGASWKKLEDKGGGYLSVYLNEPLARWPIRELTRPADNKSDPNIETATYGLFSTCEPNMRKLIVEKGAASIFFMTTLRNTVGRRLAGYYHVGWYAEGSRGVENRDYALAAEAIRFVDPIDPHNLPENLRALLLSQFRTQKPIDSAVVNKLRARVDRAVDRTSDYISEVKRIETFSRARSGYAYPSWGREGGFSWADAETYLARPASPAVVPNSSSSGRWRCGSCDRVIENRALLKRCPVCGEIATLRPEI